MPSSTVQSFTEPGDYAASIRAVTSEMIVTARGPFTAKLIRIDLHHLWMQRFFESLPRIGHSAAGKGRAFLTFHTQPGPNLLWDGVEKEPSTILRHSEGHDSFQRTSGLVSWGAMSLSVEEMAAIGATLSGRDLMPPRDALSVKPSPTALVRLQRLHTAAGDLAEHAPEVISHPEAARGLENALIQAMVACLTGRLVGAPPPRNDHAAVLCEDRGTSRGGGLHPRYLCRPRRSAADVAFVLPRKLGGWAETLPSAAPDEPGEAGVARRRRRSNDRDPGRRGFRILELRPVRRRVSRAVRRNALRDAAASAAVE